MRKRTFMIGLLSLVIISAVFIILQKSATYEAFASTSERAMHHDSFTSNLTIVNKTNFNANDENIGSNKSDSTTKTPSHEEIIAITTKFMDLLVQETDESNKVINYTTKKDFLEAFENGVAGKYVAKEYVDFYYQEKSDGIYVIPTETPPWFNENKGYNMVQLEGNKVRLIQENTSDLYGNYIVEIELTYDDGWKITEITHI